MIIYAPEIFYKLLSIDNDILPNFFQSFDLESNYEQIINLGKRHGKSGEFFIFT